MSRRASSRGAFAALEREEARALAELKRAFVAAGDDLPALADLRALARRHPELTIAASAALGVALAPVVAGLARTVLPALLKCMRSAALPSLRGLMSPRSPSPEAGGAPPRRRGPPVHR